MTIRSGKLHATLLAGAVTAGLAVAPAATASPLPLPLVRASVATARSRGKTMLLVKSITVSEVPHGAELLLGCGGCRRYPRAIHRTANGGMRSYTGLYWLIARGRAVTLTLERKGTTGRWMRLVPRRSDLKALVVDTTGCLDARERHVACPVQGAGTTTTSTPPASTAPAVAPTPAAPVTATTPVVPEPLVPGHDPIGRLLSARRISDAQVRVIGWASDEDAGSTPITVKSLLDGAAVAQATAELDRSDVGAHGFDQVVDVGYPAHTLCVVAVNVGGGQDAQLPECLKIPLGADISNDGYVGCVDFATLRANYGKSGMTWSQGDLNGDGVVNGVDVSIMSSNYAPPPGEAPC